ncbi:cobalamin B12-binding domain-containing protein [Alkalicaulis satelles]|nr:cobalamin B12-binding domain-containing protein [Alkalicaulis satelles]
MADDELTFDPETYKKAVSLYKTKSDRLAHTAIRALVDETLLRLSERARDTRLARSSDIRPELLDQFCVLITQDEPDALLAFIGGQRRAGLTRSGVYQGYIAAAAQWLGRQWQEDTLSSLQVAKASGHLYALMRALRAERPVHPVSARRSAFFATVPGEDHAVGVTLAAEIFREAGWSIDLLTGAGHQAILDRITRTRPYLIGLSLSSDRSLAALVRLVVSIRLVSPQAVIGAAPPLTLEDRSLMEMADIDLVFRDARTALSDLEALAAQG